MPTSTIVDRKQVLNFWSWPEFVDTASHNPSPQQSDHGQNAWAGGTKNLKDAVKLAQRGWEEGGKFVTAKGSAMFEELSSLVQQTVVKYSDDAGVCFDVGLVLMGEPEHWLHLDTHLTTGAGKVISIVVNLAEPGSVSPDVIMHKGAMAATVAMLIERGGHNVEIIAAIGAAEFPEGSKGRKHLTGYSMEIYVPVKRADEQINLLSVAYALAHPSTLRRMAFSAMEQLAEPDWATALRVGRSYGYTTELTHTGDIYIPSVHTWGDWTDPDKARAWVLDTMRAQGVLKTT